MTYTNWHDGRKPGAPFNSASPNLKAIYEYCHARWGLANLGCYGVRPIRGGTRWSAHSFGAAWDIGYRNGPSRDTIVNEVIPFLEANADALGIQRIHDYMAKRYWQSGKGWINRPPGDGYDWLHIETTAEAWADGRSVEERIGTAGDIPTAPKPAATSSSWTTLKLGDSGDNVVRLQEALGAKGYKNSTNRKALVADGEFGAITERRVKQFQKDAELVSDGLVGPITAKALGLI